MSFQKDYPINAQAHATHPFCRREFFEALSQSRSIGGDSGWSELYFTKNQAVLPAFLKTHSYGEYIFDWQWAQTYERYGHQYYPKLLHALPFTPVNAPKIWGGTDQDHRDLVQESFDFYQTQKMLSGEHYLFIDEELAQTLEGLGFFTMYSIQYHWQIDSSWQNFTDFLQSLKSSKRKMMRKERQKVSSYPLRIEWKQAQELTSAERLRVYQLYLETIEKKHSYAYLNQQFFTEFFSNYPQDLKVLIAYDDQEMIAMSLFMSSQDILYGRYWGIDKRYADLYPLLHFEMCYYRGMDYCLEKKMKTFEAGAQGEQKLWRGFHPVRILSAHHLRDAAFYKAISEFIVKQNEWQIEQIEQSKLYLPYQI